MVENPSASEADVDSIPGSGRSPGEGNGNPFQYPCLGKSHGQRSLQSIELQRVRYDLETKQQQQEFGKDLLNELNTFFDELPSQ